MLLPSLLQTTREQNIDKREEKLLDVFRKIDTKKNELAIAKNAIVYATNPDGSLKLKEGIALIRESRNINHLIKKYTRPEITAIIRILILNVNGYFNVKNGLSSLQVKEIAEQIMDECGVDLSIDELIYIFKKAKTTAKLYDRLDGAIIFGWIDAHYKSIADQRIASHEDVKNNATIPTYMQDLAGKFRVVSEKMVKKYELRDLGKIDVSGLTGKIKPKKKKK